jgi:hypothetical protein
MSNQTVFFESSPRRGWHDVADNTIICVRDTKKPIKPYHIGHARNVTWSITWSSTIANNIEESQNSKDEERSLELVARH